jgi:hypothetical protein
MALSGLKYCEQERFFTVRPVREAMSAFWGENGSVQFRMKRPSIGWKNTWLEGGAMCIIS